MAKPILIIEFPSYEGIDNQERSKRHKNLQSKFDDYHLLILESDTKKINFQVFYEKDFTEIQYQELKELIEDKLKLKK